MKQGLLATHDTIEKCGVGEDQRRKMWLASSEHWDFANQNRELSNE